MISLRYAPFNHHIVGGFNQRCIRVLHVFVMMISCSNALMMILICDTFDIQNLCLWFVVILILSFLNRFFYIFLVSHLL